MQLRKRIGEKEVILLILLECHHACLLLVEIEGLVNSILVDAVFHTDEMQILRRRTFSIVHVGLEPLVACHLGAHLLAHRVGDELRC